MTPSDLVTTIKSERKHRNLSSAIRLFVLDHYRRADGSSLQKLIGSKTGQAPGERH